MARLSIKAPVPEEPRQKPISLNLSAVKLSRRQFLRVITIAGVALLVIAVIFLAKDRNQLKQEVAQSAKSSQPNTADEAVQLKQEIGQYLELPADEIPEVVLVSDAEKLKSQEFFKNSQNGDKVLVFSQARKAILYRPSTKKVIEFSTLAPKSTTTPSTQ